jgi:hypothetical protein
VPEIFARYDTDADGYWSEKEQWYMLKVSWPGLRLKTRQLVARRPV